MKSDRAGKRIGFPARFQKCFGEAGDVSHAKRGRTEMWPSAPVIFGCDEVAASRSKSCELSTVGPRSPGIKLGEESKLGSREPQRRTRWVRVRPT